MDGMTINHIVSIDHGSYEIQQVKIRKVRSSWGGNHGYNWIKNIKTSISWDMGPLQLNRWMNDTLWSFVPVCYEQSPF